MNNAVKMACQIYRSGFIPDIFYVFLRGGAYVGNIISEYFKAAGLGHKILYAAVVIKSYPTAGKPENIILEGCTYDPSSLEKNQKILLIDDIFDSGRTLNYFTRIIHSHGIPLENIRIAVHDYKEKLYHKNNHLIKPSYYANYYELRSEKEDFWISYLSHEFADLPPHLIKKYFKGVPEEYFPGNNF